MRRALLALIFAGVAPVAMTTASNPAPAAAALAAPRTVDVASAVTRVDYNGRYYHRGYRHYHRRPADYGYYYAPRAYYRAPAYPPTPRRRSSTTRRRSSCTTRPRSSTAPIRRRPRLTATELRRPPTTTATRTGDGSLCWVCASLDPTCLHPKALCRSCAARPANFKALPQRTRRQRGWRSRCVVIITQRRPFSRLCGGEMLPDRKGRCSAPGSGRFRCS